MDCQNFNRSGVVCLRNKITESLMMRDLGVLRMVADSLGFESNAVPPLQGTREREMGASFR